MEATRTRVAGPINFGLFTLARVVALIGSLVAAVIVIGILLVVLDASAKNDIVQWITDAAEWLVAPFQGLFNLDSQKGQTAVNWGLAAVVYFAISRMIARLLAR
jgi:hypothetical protein